jgi:5-methylcytosine-specific restriction endonuclease McrA
VAISTKYRQYLQSSPQWDDLRRTALYRAGYRCERCGKAAPLQVHHLNYRNIFNESQADLQALCFSCHRERHFMIWRLFGIAKRAWRRVIG